MKSTFHILIITILSLILSSCYNEKKMGDHDALPQGDSISNVNSISFYTTHHYSVGYNFLVDADSLLLIKQQPEEHISLLQTDTFYVANDSHIAVYDIRIVPQDSVDSVWVQLITEMGSTGWTHETELLPNVVPTDPISQLIMLFSDTHLMLALIILALIGTAYTIRTVQRRNAPIVHFRDIPSFYPTLLCIIVAASATFYASLQMFGADTWRHFYYHPSLNPFAMPPILSIFISSIWAMLIVGVAVVVDIRYHLDTEDIILYLCSLVGVCATLYIVFSVTTLYYIGYPLLVAYCWFAVTHYLRNFSQGYTCGNCGKRIKGPGTCPHCGAIND